MSIEAMKQALEALCDFDYDKRLQVVITLRQAIEQAEKQEPVAWMNRHGACKTSLFREVEAGAIDEYTIPLYTTPQPQREWVGLNQEDIDIAFDDTQEGGGFNEFARAIEQTSKRKNT
jgi:hypothetical protein